jgi:hypothetical protein
LRRLVLGPGPQTAASQLGAAAAAAVPSLTAWSTLGSVPHLHSLKLSNTGERHCMFCCC